MFAPKQLEALKYLICLSKDGDELSKRIIMLLIDRAEGFTRDVCLTLTEGREGYSAEEIKMAACGFDFMKSANGTTHVNQIICAMGSEFRFSFCYGDFDPDREDSPLNQAGMFPGINKELVPCQELTREDMPLRQTFWLADESYSHQAKLIMVTREELDGIELVKTVPH